MSGGFERMTRELRAVGRKLLEEREVAVIIGYGAGSWGNATRPLFVTSPKQTSGLIWNQFCVGNLMVYVNRPEVRQLGRPAIVAKGCDVRSLIVLMQEHRVLREDVVVLGIGCEGVKDYAAPSGCDDVDDVMVKCRSCTVRTPPLYDHLIGGEVPPRGEGAELDLVAEIEAMDQEARWQYWMTELGRCIKCYACRAVCPQCYCDRCFVDKTRPAWTSSSHSERANFLFHLFRAFHLAGRCVGCGECERVCPQGIPIGVLNAKMAKEMAHLYGHAAGTDPDTPGPLVRFSKDDSEDFIR